MVIGYETKTVIEGEPPTLVSGGPMDSAWPVFSHDGRYISKNSYGTVEKLNLDVTSDNRFIEWIGENLKPGWPVHLDNHHGSMWAFDSSVTVADLDQDGDSEVLIHSGEGIENGKVYVFHHDGVLMDGWPIYTGSQGISTPSVGDIDPNYPGLEVVVSMNEISFTWFVYAWHSDGTPVQGWPLTAGQSFCTPAIEDIDNDGLLEIIQLIGNPGGDEWRDCKLHVWNGDGSNVSGFPIIFQSDQNTFIHGASPAVGDIDNDGDLEIIFGLSNKKMYVYKNDGNIYPGWPITLENSEGIGSSPALGDVDNDGDLEIVCGSCGDRDNIHIWHHDGTYLEGWPKTVKWIYHESPSLCDIDFDGDLEILMNYGEGSHTHDEIIIWHHDGSVVNGWPQYTTGTSRGSPIIGDINGDGDLEIISIGYGGIYAWHHNGINVDGFPKCDLGKFYGSAAIADLENNGKMDLIAGPYAWEFDETYSPIILEWPMFRHNSQHTGLYVLNHDVNNPPENLTISGPSSGKINVEYSFSAMAVDPDRDNVSFLFDWGDGTDSGWAEYVPSGTIVNVSHIWTKTGTYEIKVKAKDIYGYESEWSEPLPVKMPKNKISTLQMSFPQFLEQHPHMFPVLRCLLAIASNI